MSLRHYNGAILNFILTRTSIQSDMVVYGLTAYISSELFLGLVPLPDNIQLYDQIASQLGHWQKGI